MSTRTHVILCTEEGKPLGKTERTEAHAKGLLHLAFSIYLFRKNRTELLMQKRSTEKQLWGGIWANTCCSHPQGGDVREEAAKRLEEEFGFSHPLEEAGAFLYRAEDPGGKGIEHEYDILLVGDAASEIEPHPDPKEIAEWKWMNVHELEEEMQTHPKHFAPWLHRGLPQVLSTSSPSAPESPSS